MDQWESTIYLGTDNSIRLGSLGTHRGFRNNDTPVVTLTLESRKRRVTVCRPTCEDQELPVLANQQYRRGAPLPIRRLSLPGGLYPG